MQIHNAVITGSFSYNGADLSNVTSSNAYSASLSSRTTNLETTASSLVIASASFSSRTTQVERTYASTGSNTFTGLQNFSNTCNPIGFNSVASMYTAGGLQVTYDSYFSSSVFVNGNLTVFGTQSVVHVSSSQFNIGTNIITVNTSTPSIRYGGLSVYDSGSTGLSGSIFWDSEANHWVYANASGSGGGDTYTGGMFISGPRNTRGLGCEQGTTSCMLLVGQGGDHLTSSMIYHDSARTCFYGNSLIISGSGNIGLGNSSPSYQLDMCSGTTVNQRIRLQRGSDDTNQNMLLGWNNITVTRNNVSISGNQTDFSIIQCGSDGARVPFYIGVGGVSCFGCGTLVCGNIGITSTCSKFYQLTNNCKSADSVLDIYNTATDGFGVAIQAGANNNNYALAVSNFQSTPLLHVAGNGLIGINCGQPNARLTINNGNCINAINIYGCNSAYTSQVGFYDSTNVVANGDGIGGQRIALIEIGTVAGTGTGCRGANMALYTHQANGSLKLPLLLMHNGNVCLVDGNLYTTCTLFAPGTPMQVTAGSTTFTSGNSGVTAGLGAAAAGSTPAYNAGCVILSVNFTPKSATSKILIQTTNVSMWEVTNVSDHFYLFASNDTAGTVLTKAGSYLQGFGPNNQNGAIISLNGIANSWGTSTNTISFRAASTGGTDQYQYNPFYGVSGFSADTVGFFGYSITEIS